MATVSALGAVTGVTEGTATISASAGGRSGSSTITVKRRNATLQVTGITPSTGAANASIESTIQIQFSAPVTVATVTPTTVSISRAGGGGVAGTLTVSGNTVTFTPTGLLTEFATAYVVTVTTGVLSAQGDYLAAQFSSSFTTAFWDPTYYYRITNEAYAGRALDTFSGTFGCFLGNTGNFSGQHWYFVPIAGQAGFYYLKNEFQGDTKALEGSDVPNRCFLANPGPTGQFLAGQAWRVVAYGAPYANGFRLQNQNHGAAKSLGAILVNNEPFPSMQATANVSNQVWYFARLARR